MLVVAVVAGCGGGDGGGDERLSKDEYLQEFRAIGDDLQSTFAEFESPDVDTTDLDAVAELTVRVGDSFDEIGDRVGALTPPEEVQGAHDKLVDGLHEFAVWFRDLADQIRTTPAPELQNQLEELGLLGEFDPTKVEAAQKIQEAVDEFTEKGYTFEGEQTETFATEGPGDPDAGKEVFASAGCGACHTLADAGSTGAIGPSLDAAAPPYGKVVERVTNGASVMPSFKDTLSKQQIQDVAAYVSSVAGG
jgi:mono/diheme cytochrome c family protein